MFFKLFLTELPKHRICYTLIGWKEAGLGGLNVKHWIIILDFTKN